MQAAEMRSDGPQKLSVRKAKRHAPLVAVKPQPISKALQTSNDTRAMATLPQNCSVDSDGSIKYPTTKRPEALECTTVGSDCITPIATRTVNHGGRVIPSLF